MTITTIPGLNVTKIGRDKYAVSVNNSNFGAAVINKAQLKTLADSYGVPMEDKKSSTAKKVLAGVVAAGAIAAGVIYRKNIGKFFKGLFNGKNGEKVKDAAADSKKAAESLYDRVAGSVTSAFKKTKEFGKDIYNSVCSEVKKLFGKKDKKYSATVFGSGCFSPEFKKARKESILALVRGFEDSRSGRNISNYNKRKAELIEAFSAITPRSSLK